MTFTVHTNLNAVERYLTREFGPMAEFADNIGEDLPEGTLIWAMNAVNAAIGSDVDLLATLADAVDEDGRYLGYEVTDRNSLALGRADDILVYLAELGTEFAEQDTWAAYIGEAREAE